jgi:hypothetical protein
MVASRERMAGERVSAWEGKIFVRKDGKDLGKMEAHRWIRPLLLARSSARWRLHTARGA